MASPDHLVDVVAAEIGDVGEIAAVRFKGFAIGHGNRLPCTVGGRIRIEIVVKNDTGDRIPLADFTHTCGDHRAHLGDGGIVVNGVVVGKCPLRMPDCRIVVRQKRDILSGGGHTQRIEPSINGERFSVFVICGNLTEVGKRVKVRIRRLSLLARQIRGGRENVGMIQGIRGRTYLKAQRVEVCLPRGFHNIGKLGAHCVSRKTRGRGEGNVEHRGNPQPAHLAAGVIECTGAYNAGIRIHCRHTVRSRSRRFIGHEIQPSSEKDEKKHNKKRNHDPLQNDRSHLHFRIPSRFTLISYYYTIFHPELQPIFREIPLFYG